MISKTSDEMISHINAELEWQRIMSKYVRLARNHGYGYDEMMHQTQEIERGWPAHRDITNHQLIVDGREMVTITVTRTPMVDFKWTVTTGIGEVTWPSVREGWEDVCLYCGGDILHKRAVKCEWAWWSDWIFAWLSIGQSVAIDGGAR